MNRFLKLVVSLALMLGLTVAVAPGASAAIGSSTYVPDSSVSMRATTKVIYNVDSGGSKTFDGCYDVSYGYNALAAFMEVTRTGDFVGDMNGYLGEEDSELVSLALMLHDRLSGTAYPRGDVHNGGWITCLAPSGYVLGSLASSGASLGTSSVSTPITQPGIRTATKRIFYPDSGGNRYYSDCYTTLTGPQGIAYALEMLRTGNFPGYNQYIGHEDSEFVNTILTVRQRLLGQRPPREDFFGPIYPNVLNCQP